MNRNFIKTKFSLFKIFLLALGWGIAGAIFAINDYMSIVHFAKDIGINTDIEFNFSRNLITSVLNASIGGILI